MRVAAKSRNSEYRTDEQSNCEVLEWKEEGSVKEYGSMWVSVGTSSPSDLKMGVTAGDLACSSACLRGLHGFELP